VITVLGLALLFEKRFSNGVLSNVEITEAYRSIRNIAAGFNGGRWFFVERKTMGRHIPYESRSDYATVALLILIAGLVCFDVFILIYGINNGINDLHGFRQSQTALTAYWLDREPHGLAYVTPVLGYPWSVPFEFPVYQWIVVLLMKAGVPLVIGGRLVSFAAFVACLVPLKVMARDFNVPNRAFLFIAAIYLACPFYIFWSRTFMIETTALLFSLYWLAGFVRFGLHQA
jgi:hypothetical protein